MSAIAELPEKPPVAITPTPAKLPGEEAASFLESLNGDRSERRKPAPAPDKTDEEKAKAEKEAADKAKADKESKSKAVAAPKKKPPTPPAQPAAEPDYEKIAEAAGRGVAAAIKRTEADSKADEPLADLSPDEREFHEAYAQMEKDYGDQYKGLAKRYLDSLKAADEWETKWLETHPGQELNESNQEYQDFVAKNAVKYSDLHLHKSLARIEAEKMVKAEREKGSAEVEDLKRDQKLAKAVPAIIAQRAASAREYFTALGDEFKDVLDAAGNINREAIGKLLEADPLKQIALTTAEHVEGFADELYRLSNALTPFDSNNGAHSFIASFVAENESYLEQLPADEQAAFVEKLPPALQADKVGRRFATAEKYGKLTAAQRAHYFRLRNEDVAYLYAVSQAESARKAIAAEEKRVDELAAKRGFKKVDAVSQATTATAAPPPPPTPPTPIPPSPSGSIEPRQALPSGGGTAPKKNAADSFTAQWLG